MKRRDFLKGLASIPVILSTPNLLANTSSKNLHDFDLVIDPEGRIVTKTYAELKRKDEYTYSLKETQFPEGEIHKNCYTIKWEITINGMEYTKNYTIQRGCLEDKNVFSIRAAKRMYNFLLVDTKYNIHLITPELKDIKQQLQFELIG